MKSIIMKLPPKISPLMDSKWTLGTGYPMVASEFWIIVSNGALSRLVSLVKIRNTNGLERFGFASFN